MVQLQNLADLIGLTARSHSLPLRHCLDYLTYRYNHDLHPRGSYMVYDMVLLRIADYLQINADRAPRILMHLRNLQSTISIDEWNKHSAVAHISYEHEDPQAIKVDFNNKHSLHTHLQMKELLSSLQNEMDISSAVLRQVYGHATKYQTDNLRLSKNYIRSNIDSVALKEQLPYVPIHSGLTSDPQLLTLLVAPLYSAAPEIGIREFLQNAVDAVRERDVYCKKYSIETSTLEFPEQDFDVYIELIEQETNKWTLLIKDKGIGMEVDTICNYFLRAGASFFRSEAWNRDFSDRGNSLVSRSGHFGIGTFAGFLLSDTIKVITRHISSRIGYTFHANNTAELIEITKIPTYIGTTIEMMLDEEVGQQLLDNDAWDWFTLNTPSVGRLVRLKNGQQLLRKAKYNLPSDKVRSFSTKWRFICPDNYSVVHWTYDHAAPNLVCNGIIIAKLDDNSSKKEPTLHWGTDRANIPFHHPSISVFDPDCNLPLTIARDKLIAQPLSFSEALLEDVILDFIAFCLVCSPTTSIWDTSIKNSFRFTYGYPLWRSMDSFVWFYTSYGVAPFDPWLLFNNLPKNLIVAGSVGSNCPYFPLRGNNIYEDCVTIFFHVIESDEYFSFKEGFMALLRRIINFFDKTDEKETFSLSEIFDDFDCHWSLKSRFAASEISIKQALKEQFGIESELISRRGNFNINKFVYNPNKLVISEIDFDPSLFDNNSVIEDIGMPCCLRFKINGEYKKNRVIEPKSLIAKKWNEYLGNGIIPFDAQAREQLIQNVSNKHPKLRDYIAAWRLEHADWIHHSDELSAFLFRVSID